MWPLLWLKVSGDHSLLSGVLFGFVSTCPAYGFALTIGNWENKKRKLSFRIYSQMLIFLSSLCKCIFASLNKNCVAFYSKGISVCVNYKTHNDALMSIKQESFYFTKEETEAQES